MGHRVHRRGQRTHRDGRGLRRGVCDHRTRSDGAGRDDESLPAAQDPASTGDRQAQSAPGDQPGGIREDLAQLAVDELNAEGGLGKRSVRLVVGDDATDPTVAAAEAHRLILAGCRALLACVTSASFNAAQHAVHHTRIPLVHAVINEGGSGPRHVFRLGERPADQLRLAAGPLMHETGAWYWFLIGNDYCWSHGAHRDARQVLSGADAVVTGEHCAPLGTRDFSHVLDQIRSSGADLVLSTLIGADEVAFERQSRQAGLRDRCRTSHRPWT